jgi:hypothetical protein
MIMDRRNDLALYGLHCYEQADFGYCCPHPRPLYRRAEQFIRFGGVGVCIVNLLFFAAQVVLFQVDWYDWLIGGSGVLALVASIAFGWLPQWRRTWGDPIWRKLREARDRLLNRDIPESWRENILDELPLVTGNLDWVTFDFALAKDAVVNCSYHRPLDVLVVSAEWLDYQLIRVP